MSGHIKLKNFKIKINYRGGGVLKGDRNRQNLNFKGVDIRITNHYNKVNLKGGCIIIK